MERLNDPPLVRTDERHGVYFIYERGIMRWYRCEGGEIGHPEWYVWHDHTQAEACHGEYVDYDPAKLAYSNLHKIGW